MNIFKKIFAILGGADISVLSLCPIEEQNKWASAGIMNLLTSVIFGVMVANAFSGIFEKPINLFFLFLIFLFFTSISFVITYALSGTIKNSKRGLSKLLALAPRLAISIVFSLLCTGAVTTLVYNSFLPHGRMLLKLNAINASNDLISPMKKDEQLRLRNELTRLDYDINELITKNSELVRSNPSVIHAIEERDALSNRLNTLTTEYRNANLAASNRIAETRRYISTINNEIESLQNQSENVQRRIQDLNASVVANNSIINNEFRAINSRNTELSNMQSQQNALQTQLQQRMLEIGSQNQDRIAALTHQHETTETAYRKIGDDINKAVKENEDEIGKTFSPGLIANLVTLEYLMSFRNDVSASFEDQQIGKMISATFLILTIAMIFLDISPILILLIHGSKGMYEFKIFNLIETKKEEENFDKASILFIKELDTTEVMKERKIIMEAELSKIEAEARTQLILDLSKDLLDKTTLFNEQQRNAFAAVAGQLEPINNTSTSDWADTACSILETYIDTRKKAAEQFLTELYAKHPEQSIGFA